MAVSARAIKVAEVKRLRKLAKTVIAAVGCPNCKAKTGQSCLTRIGKNLHGTIHHARLRRFDCIKLDLKDIRENENLQPDPPQLEEDRYKVFREASRAAKPLIAATSQGVVIADCCSSQLEFLYDRGKISTLDFKEFQHQLTDVRINLAIAQKIAAKLSTALQIQVDLKIQSEQAAEPPTCSECGMGMKPFGSTFRCDNCGSTSGCS